MFKKLFDKSLDNLKHQIRQRPYCFIRRFFLDIQTPDRMRECSVGERVYDLLKEIFHEATSVKEVVCFKKKSL